MDIVPSDGLITEAHNIDKLVNHNLVSPKEIGNATFNQIDELAQRFDQFENMYTQEEIPEAAIRAKIESILGLGDKSKNPSRFKLKIDAFITSLYLKYQFPNTFAGLVLYGSRVNPNKTPGRFSDQDIALITNPNIKSAADIPLNEILFVQEAENFAQGVFKVPVELSVIWGYDLVRYKDPNVQKGVTANYKNIDMYSIPIIPDSSARDGFKKTFETPLRKPQTDFRPDLISATLGK